MNFINLQSYKSYKFSNLTNLINFQFYEFYEFYKFINENPNPVVISGRQSEPNYISLPVHKKPI